MSELSRLVAEECSSFDGVLDRDRECRRRESVACHKEVTMRDGGTVLVARSCGQSFVGSM